MGKYIELSRQALQPIGGMYRVVVTQLLEHAYSFISLSLRNTEKKVPSWLTVYTAEQVMG